LGDHFGNTSIRLSQLGPLKGEGEVGDRLLLSLLAMRMRSRYGLRL
jgi:hypothetical protein